jgi:hypothetical protein
MIGRLITCMNSCIRANASWQLTLLSCLVSKSIYTSECVRRVSIGYIPQCCAFPKFRVTPAISDDDVPLAPAFRVVPVSLFKREKLHTLNQRQESKLQDPLFVLHLIAYTWLFLKE